MIPWAAVVGFPIKHSLSPRIFQAFRRTTGRALHYRALSLRPETFEQALKTTSHGSWIGWNVTLPYKVAALALMDSLDPSACETGSVNVICFQEGRRIGYNTDGNGFLASLDRRSIRLRGIRAVIFGAGGAARAVCATLRKQAVESLLVINRSPGKALELAQAFGGTTQAWEPESIRRAAATADLLINATSLGLDGWGSPLPEKTYLKPGALAYDLIYRPRMTPFLSQARQAGAEAMGGLGMLVLQAAATWKIWFGEILSGKLLENVETQLEGLLE
jgi:shikimate dehydrogenase